MKIRNQVYAKIELLVPKIGDLTVANYTPPLRDTLFVINQVLDYPAHYQALGFADELPPDMVETILSEAGKFSSTVLAPIRAIGDQQGCQLTDGKVTIPAEFKAAYDQFVENGWPALSMPTEFGGQGLPESLGTICYEFYATANHAWLMYVGLTHGAVSTLIAHGKDAQKAQFLPKLISGEWSGTMCLTESQAGTDLGLLRTQAQPNDDGSYAITGSKIFISAGDHNLTDNIIHIVLARLPDAPNGVGGISLFLVPKFRLDESGNASAANGVSCGSLEEKMGIHGNSTCVMNFDSAQGFLLGEANRGLACMFTFINESRLGVGQQGHAHIEASFQTALAYAQERLQMRAPNRKNTDKPADPIIVHPDVRRMLMTQKVFAEGGRVFNFYCAQQVDNARYADSEEEREKAENLLAFLTPIVKGFLTEVSLEATSDGVQILGGHGYIRESGQEQEYRDTRITAIYEGTNGIQALDLLGRKVLGSRGKLLASFLEQVRAFCAQNDAKTEIPEMCNSLLSVLDDWQSLANDTGQAAMKNPDEVGAASYDFLMFSGYAVLAYFWARSALAASQQLEGNDPFFQAKGKSAEFYFAKILPRTQLHANNVRAGSSTLMALDADHFLFG